MKKGRGEKKKGGKGERKKRKEEEMKEKRRKMVRQVCYYRHVIRMSSYSVGIDY